MIQYRYNHKMEAYLLILCLQPFLTFSYDKQNIPVLIWKNKDDKYPTEWKFDIFKDEISTEEFKDIISLKIKDNPVIIVFAETRLSNVNVLGGNEDESILLPQLKKLVGQMEHAMYLPKVNEPLFYFSEMRHLKWRYLTLKKGATSLDICTQSNSSLLIRLDGGSSSNRRGLLERHDEIIVKTYNAMVKQHSTVLAVYTAAFPYQVSEKRPKNRALRSEKTIKMGRPTLFFSNGILLYSKTNPKLRISASSHVEDLIFKNFNNENNLTATNAPGTLRVALPENELNLQSVVFQYTTARDRWTMDRIYVMQDQRVHQKCNVRHQHTGNATLAAIQNIPLTLDAKSTRIKSLMGFSYHCNVETSFTDKKQTMRLIFKTIQTQPNITEMRFGEAVDCTCIFSLGTLLSTILFFIFLAIFLIMVTMMTKIQTNYEFENPKEPHLVIQKAKYFDKKKV